MIKLKNQDIYKVPFIVCHKSVNIDNIEKLSDIAPFVLNLMDIDVPKEMK